MSNARPWYNIVIVASMSWDLYVPAFCLPFVATRDRRFEMYQNRQIICSMRLVESDRTIAKAGLMGRKKASELRRIALEQRGEKGDRHQVIYLWSGYTVAHIVLIFKLVHSVLP